MKQGNIQSIISALIGFVLSLIASILPILEIYRLLIVLLLYLVTLILFSVNTSKRSTKQSESLSLIDGIEYDLKSAVKEAKNSIFISGTTLSALCGYRDLFVSLPERVRLELVLLNNDDADLMKKHYDMVGGPNTPEKMKIQYQNFLILAKELENRKNTYIKYVDHIMPISYVGIDVDSAEAFSKIKSQHYVQNIHGGEGSIGFEVKTGTELFKIYKKQIDLLREESKKLILSPKTE